MRGLLPGLLAATAIAAIARTLAGILPASIADVTVALLLGLALAQVAGSRAAALVPGAMLAARLLLRWGIVLLGARLSLGQIVAIGLPATIVVAVTMTAVFATVLLVARAARIEGPLAVLLAVGTAVCGNSAIIATAPVIGARGREVAYAVATITLFGTLAVLIYPAIGHLLGMTDTAFGLWSGIAVNDTSQVVAASSSYSARALEVATVVKLIRNAMMAPLLVLISWQWARRTGLASGTTPGLRRAVPLFVLGFVAMAGLRSVGLIDAPLAGILDTAARLLILVALAGVGLTIRLAELRSVGPRPLGVGLAAAVTAGAATIIGITILNLGSTIRL
jgi:uncharacterized integral membrane protein (TIGR00698 family)